MPEAKVHHAFTIDGFAPELRVREIEGSEGLSQLFAFEVVVSCDEPVPFDDVAGKPARLTLQVDEEDEPRFVNGMVSRVEHAETRVSALQSGGTSFGYRFTLVPKVWRLLHRADARIFQDMTAPKVIEKVFGTAKLVAGDDFRVSLQGTYAEREYCVQYRESDWDFASRLMEEEGIYYYFEQLEDRAVLVLGDKKETHADIAGQTTLPFRPPRGALDASQYGQHVSRFTLAREVRPGKVTLRDYDFKKPSLSLEASEEADVEKDLEVYDYPGAYVTPSEGGALASVRLDELRALRTAGEGDSFVTQLLPGCCFTLDQHPVDDHNRRYLVTRVEHHGVVPLEDDDTLSGEWRPPYANRFDVIPQEVPFRPARLTRKPLIHGVQTAQVVGPAGEEIYTDAHGRIKVQFHWDRLGKKDEKSSCWMRVSQVWAGPAWGAVFLPRVGHEVVVTFLEGDPDRPLVVGSVYHGTNVPPYSLPDEKTKSTIYSQSSLGGEGWNELRFEDGKGKEEVFLHAQKDWNIVVKNDKTQKIGHDETLTVEHDRTKEIKHDQKLTVGNDETVEVKHDRKTKIGHDEQLEVGHDRKTTVKNDHTEAVEGNQTVTVTKDQKTKVDGAQELAVAKTQKMTVGEDATHEFNAALALTVAKDRTEKVTGDAALTVDKAMTVTVTKSHALKADSSTHAVAKTHALKADQEIAIECGQATITIKSDGSLEIKGTKLAVKCQGDVKVEGMNVELKANGTAKIEANGQVTIKGSGPVQVSSSAVVKVAGSMVNVG